MSNDDDLFLKMFNKALAGALGARKDKPGGITPQEFKKRILEAYDDDLFNAIGTLCNGKKQYAIIAALTIILGDVIANVSGDEESACDSSHVVGDMLHNYAHHAYRQLHANKAKPAHEGNAEKH